MNSERILERHFKGRTVFVATNAYGDTTCNYVRSLFNLPAQLKALGVRMYFELAEGHANNARIRNMLVAKALAIPEVTDFVFIDADISFDFEAFLRLFPTAERGIMPIVGGAPMRRGVAAEKDGTRQFCWHPAEGESLQMTPNGHIRADVATAFLKIEREVFEGIAAKRPDLKWEHDAVGPDAQKHLYAFFGWGPQRAGRQGDDEWERLEGSAFFEDIVTTTFFATTGEKLPAKLLKDAAYRERVARELAFVFAQGAGCKDPLAVERHFIGEDYWFAKLAREAGFESWLDPRITLGHQDKLILKGQVADHIPAEFFEEAARSQQEAA